MRRQSPALGTRGEGPVSESRARACVCAANELVTNGSSASSPARCQPRPELAASSRWPRRSLTTRSGASWAGALGGESPSTTSSKRQPTISTSTRQRSPTRPCARTPQLLGRMMSSSELVRRPQSVASFSSHPSAGYTSRPSSMSLPTRHPCRLRPTAFCDTTAPTTRLRRRTRRPSDCEAPRGALRKAVMPSTEAQSMSKRRFGDLRPSVPHLRAWCSRSSSLLSCLSLPRLSSPFPPGPPTRLTRALAGGDCTTCSRTSSVFRSRGH